MQEPGLGMIGGSGGGGDDHQDRHLKAEIATHPLYEQLLSAHVSCLRVATPIDQLPLIDAQLSQSHHLLRSYASLAHSSNLSPHDRQDLDNFLVTYYCVNYTFFFLFGVWGKNKFFLMIFVICYLIWSELIKLLIILYCCCYRHNTW